MIKTSNLFLLKMTSLARTSSSSAGSSSAAESSLYDLAFKLLNLEGNPLKADILKHWLNGNFPKSSLSAETMKSRVLALLSQWGGLKDKDFPLKFALEHGYTCKEVFIEKALKDPNHFVDPNDRHGADKNGVSFRAWVAARACLEIDFSAAESKIHGEGLSAEVKSLANLEESAILGGAIMVLYNPEKKSFWVLGDADRPAPNQEAKFKENILKGIPDENPNKAKFVNVLNTIVKLNPATFTFRDNGTGKEDDPLLSKIQLLKALLLSLLQNKMASKLTEQGVGEALLTPENIQMCCNIFINDGISRIYDAIGETFSVSLSDLKKAVVQADTTAVSAVQASLGFDKFGDLGKELSDSLSAEMASIRSSVLDQALKELITTVATVALEEEFPVSFFKPQISCFLSNGTDRRTNAPKYTAVLYAETNATKEELEHWQLIRKNYAIEQFFSQ